MDDDNCYKELEFDWDTRSEQVWTVEYFEIKKVLVLFYLLSFANLL